MGASFARKRTRLGRRVLRHELVPFLALWPVFMRGDGLSILKACSYIFLPNMCLCVASEVTLLEIPPCQTPMCGVAYSCSYVLLVTPNTHTTHTHTHTHTHTSARARAQSTVDHHAPGPRLRTWSSARIKLITLQSETVLKFQRRLNWPGTSCKARCCAEGDVEQGTTTWIAWPGVCLTTSKTSWDRSKVQFLRF